MNNKVILRKFEPPEHGNDAANHPDYAFWCPGCNCSHAVWVSKLNRIGASWTFNGDMEKPTFSPSFLLRYTVLPEREPSGDFKRGPDGKYLVDDNRKILGSKEVVCHTFVRSGNIEFLGDCTHHLAGKTVPMEAF